MLSLRKGRKFRDHIFANFALYSVVVLVGSAMTVFATYQLTEDAVVGNVLANLATHETHPVLFAGRQAELPPAYQPMIESLAPGLTELEGTPGEAAVYKLGAGDDARYTLLVLPDDGEGTAYYIALGLGFVCLLALALGLSWRLAKQFSAPIERISSNLASEQPVLSATSDVEELAYLAERLEQYRRDRNLRLAQANTFSQSISHELRTPITVIQGAVELLEAEEHSARARSKVARIQRAVEHLSLTTEVLLHITRAEHQLEGNDFVSALHTVVEQQQGLAEPQVAIALQIDGHPASVYEWAPLVVVLQTLLANSVRHTAIGSIELRVTQSGAIVKDTGPGMSDDCLRRVQSNGVGNGRLGYAIAHRICERCDWELRIEPWAEGLQVSILFEGPYQSTLAMT